MISHNGILYLDNLEMDLNNEEIVNPQGYLLILCKPNREEVAIIDKYTGFSFNRKIGSANELKITLHYWDFNDEFIMEKNYLWDLVKGDYLIHLIGQNVNEYFTINKPKTNTGDKDIKELACFSQEYELTKKIIKGLKGTYKLFDISSDNKGILNYLVRLAPSWSVGNIDAEIALKYRTFDVSEKNIFDFLLTDIQKAFNCILVFDTINKQIHAKQLETIGSDRGLYISEENYITTIDEEIDHDDVITRLFPYGKDDLTINGVNVTGASYIEDFTFFKSTDYMSQSLINALNTYDALLINKQGQVLNLFNTLKTYQNDLNAKIVELSALQADMMIALNNLDGAIKSNNQAQMDEFNGKKDIKQAQLDKKDEEITLIKNNMTSIQSQLLTLQSTIKKENNFTSQQIKELDVFIKEKSFRDDYYTDAAILLEEGKLVLSKLRFPNLKFTISIIDFLKIVEFHYDWDKLNLGDIVTIRSSKMNMDYKVRLIAYTHEPESGNLTLEFSNRESLEDSYIYLNDILNQAISTSTTLDIERFKYGKYAEERTDIIDFINGELDASKNRVLAGRNQDIQISERGIICSDKTNNMEELRILNNIIVLTDDGWATARTAISPKGVVAERLFGKIIAGAELLIENTSGTFKLDAEGLTVKDMNATFTKGDNTSRVIINGEDGIKIQKASGNIENPWKDNFFSDVDGNLVLMGLIKATDFQTEDGISFLSDDKKNINGDRVNGIRYLHDYANLGNLNDLLKIKHIDFNTKVRISTYVGDNGQDKLSINANTVKIGDKVDMHGDSLVDMGEVYNINMADSYRINMSGVSYITMADALNIDMTNATVDFTGATVLGIDLGIGGGIARFG